MHTSHIKHTIKKGNIFYLNFRINSKKSFRLSLKTDSRKFAQLIIAKVTPLIFKLKSLGNGMDSTDKINKLVAVLTLRIKEHAHVLLNPTSREATGAKEDYEDVVDYVVNQNADYVENDIREFLGGSEQATSSTWLREGDSAENLEMIGVSEDDVYYRNGIRALDYVYHQGRKVGRDIENFDYDKAEETLGKLQKYSEKLNKVLPPEENTVVEVVIPKPVKKELLVDWIAKFTKEKQWSERIGKSNKNLFETLVVVLGDVDITSIKGHTLDEAFTTLRDATR